LVLDFLERARQILILTHNNPDGDALGSARALALTLAASGRRADLALTGTWTQALSFLLADLSVIDFPDDFSAYDLVTLLDCHSLGRLEKIGLQTFSADSSLVVIDHHPLKEAEKTGAAWFLDPTASSTGEMVWRLLSAMNLNRPLAAEEALLLAMASDTGFFSQNNTTTTTFKAAADLVERGVSLEAVHRHLRGNWPLKYFKLMGRTLDSLKLYCGNRLAVMTVTPDDLRAVGAVMADTENLVEIGRGLAGVTLSVLVKDNGLGGIRVSLRSREPVNAANLAALFGGGGHRQASAYNDSQAATVEEAVDNLLARVDNFL